MVNANAHGCVVLATDIKERHEACINLFNLFGILFVGIFQLFERSSWVYIVAGINANLLNMLRSHVGNVGIEMHIGNKWRV